VCEDRAIRREICRQWFLVHRRSTDRSSTTAERLLPGEVLGNANGELVPTGGWPTEGKTDLRRGERNVTSHSQACHGRMSMVFQSNADIRTEIGATTVDLALEGTIDYARDALFHISKDRSIDWTT
jgi:hypothetical protein